VANDDILDTKEVAKLLKVSTRTITKLAERGELSGFKVGDLWRFQRSDVEAFIVSQKRKRQQGEHEP
jgi:excisionase family DNA binding protein